MLALYDRALPEVYGYLLDRCGNVALAEDLTSETFLAAVRAVKGEAAPPPDPISVAWGPEPVIHDEPGAPAVRLGFMVADTAEAVAQIEGAGGRIDRAEVADDGGGWAMAEDGQGISLVVWRPDRDHPHDPASREATAQVDSIQIVVRDADRARALYHSLAGVSDIGFVESADDAPAVKLYFTVDDVDAVAASVRRLGGSTGEHYRFGAGDAIDCTDDQGTRFSIVART